LGRPKNANVYGKNKHFPAAWPAQKYCYSSATANEEYIQAWQRLDCEYFLLYLRNKTSHRMDPWGKQLLALDMITPVGSLQYTPAGADNVALIRFRRVIAILQKLLFDENQLSELGFEYLM
jgi:hypothetical protein